MGWWAWDIFIQTTDVDAIGLALEQVLALDGYKPVARPKPKRGNDYVHYEFGELAYLRDGLLGVLIIPGRFNNQTWSYIRTSPNWLLCERPQGIPGQD